MGGQNGWHESTPKASPPSVADGRATISASGATTSEAAAEVSAANGQPLLLFDD